MFPFHRYFMKEIISFPGRFQIFMVPVLSLYTARSQREFRAILGVPSVSLRGQWEGSGGGVIRRKGPQSPLLHPFLLTLRALAFLTWPKDCGLLQISQGASSNNFHVRLGLSERQILQILWPIPRSIFRKAILKDPFPKLVHSVPFNGAHYIMHSGYYCVLSLVCL